MSESKESRYLTPTEVYAMRQRSKEMQNQRKKMNEQSLRNMTTEELRAEVERRELQFAAYERAKRAETEAARKSAAKQRAKRWKG